MAIKRVMGTETEYGIVGGDANDVLNNFQGKSQSHKNKSETNKSAVAGMIDKGHFGGDYVGQEMDETIARNIRLIPARGSRYAIQRSYPITYAYGSYFGRDEMLANGARFYVDMGHPEYSTPECSNPVSAVIADKAGERILEIASEGGKIARIFKNNTDGTNSYGAHENYFVDRSKVKQFKRFSDFMTPFFVSRPIFTGSGKIGFVDDQGRKLQEKMKGILTDYRSLQNLAIGQIADLYAKVEDGLEEVIGDLREDEFIFHISQRADFFTELIGLQTTYDRPIINTRDEPLADGAKYIRFHVINGDANMSEVATYMKLGTAALALDLFEDRKMKTLRLEDAVKAFHDISKDLKLQTMVKVKKQGEMTALEIQRAYQEAAESTYRGRDNMTDDILNRWKFMLDALENSPAQLNRQVDWIIKKNLIDSYKLKTGKRLSDTAVRNIDLQYHEINRDKGLFFILQSKGMIDRMISDEQIEYAIENPPEDTRAYLRGELIRGNNILNSDWDKLSLVGQSGIIVLPEPFMGTKEEVGHLFNGKNLTGTKLLRELKKKGYVKTKRSPRKIYKKQGGKTNGTTKISTVQPRSLPRKRGRS